MQNEALASRLGWAVWEYDFAKHGGAISSIAITPKLIPTGGIILGGIVHVKTAPVGSGASVAFQAVAAGDILETTAITALTLNALLDVVPVYTAATSIRCTAHTQLTMVITGAALTAGKIAVGLSWGSTD
jgi:hypothetical protein